MIRPFERGPDHTLELVADVFTRVTLDGYLLMIDDRYDRILVEFDGVPYWLPSKIIDWATHDVDDLPPSFNIPVVGPDGRVFPSERAPDLGPARFSLPAWLVNNLERLSTAALLDRRREEAVLREAEKEAERKRGQREQRRRMGQAAVAAKAKAARTAEPDLFDP